MPLHRRSRTCIPWPGFSIGEFEPLRSDHRLDTLNGCGQRAGSRTSLAVLQVERREFLACLFGVTGQHRDALSPPG